MYKTAITSEEQLGRRLQIKEVNILTEIIDFHSQLPPMAKQCNNEPNLADNDLAYKTIEAEIDNV